MRKKGNVLFVVVCLVLCIFPFVGMTFAPTETTTENRKMAEFPQLKQDGAWNREYLQELGAYFEDHLAFRPALVMADSLIQSKVFGVSNMDTVIVGENGWLYYMATLDDYQGANGLSDRGLYNAVHNLSLMQNYVQQRGSEFLLTIAPNKNSLYGENMPYYLQTKVSEDKNINLLALKLDEMGIVYADLYDVFSNEEEVLYLKKDSHWNQKGAVLAYNTILDCLGCEHESFETIANIRTRTEYGDLNKMMYPISFAPEWNYSYQTEPQFRYVTDTKSVEDAWIETENDAGEGSLLMFRDSFGNTLLPLMADTVQKGYFSKGEPYNIEKYMNSYTPEYVVVEKVERNIRDFAINPPIMTVPVEEFLKVSETRQTESTLDITEAEADTSYWLIRGLVEEEYIQTETNIYINIIADGKTTTYEAFTVTDDLGDNGYQIYIPKTEIVSEKAQIEVLVRQEDAIYNVLSQEMDINELKITKEE